MESILNDSNFNEFVSDGVVLVDFFATWCGPCKMIAPIVEQIAHEYAGRVKVGKLDVDENAKVAEAFGIYSIPALFIFKDGEVKEKLIGFRLKSQIEEYIEKYL
ncbi:MAG: thioredoxin [Clostridiales bacterium]|nr:thioredoxin [Clostridiales bacterium]